MRSPTLIERVSKTFILLTLTLFIVFSSLALLIAFIVEDSVIHNVLRQASLKQPHNTGIVKQVSYRELVQLGYQSQSDEQLKQRVNGFAEFSSGDEYYHFMVLENGYLLANSTQLLAVSKRLSGIIKLLLFAFIPCLIVTIFTARRLTKRSLQPFIRLKERFVRPDKTSVELVKGNELIQEQDVKLIADELATALSQKERTLTEQITFNQGISHELRSPLQSMAHAVELIAIKYPDLANQQVYKRLNNSLNKMHRVSEAMLWLLSKEPSQDILPINQCLTEIHDDLLSMYKVHGLKLEIVESGQLFLDIPKVVFEFIAYALVNNAVHHSTTVENKKPLRIDVNCHCVTFENPHQPNQVEPTDEFQHFGLGLLLVTQLAERFGHAVEVKQDASTFSVSIGRTQTMT